MNRTWTRAGTRAKKISAGCSRKTSRIREYLSEKLKAAGVSKIVIERPHKKCRITIHSARPGVVIGKKGADIEKLKERRPEIHLGRSASQHRRDPQAEIDAKLVAENIAQQLERRVAFRRVMKRAVQSASAWARSAIRIKCGGRLGGAEIARVEWYHEGRVLRCTRCAPTSTTASRPRRRPTAPAGVKVWIFKGGDHGTRPPWPRTSAPPKPSRAVAAANAANASPRPRQPAK
ncbi:MAG: 30S ribosomal protein S3 [Rhizomicrobium sp.]